MIMAWDNDCKARYIYLLLFSGMRVYVGQTSKPSQRLKAHARKSEGWKETFKHEIIDCVLGRQVHALELEYAWRWRLHQDGWKVIKLGWRPFNMEYVNERAKELAESF